MTHRLPLIAPFTAWLATSIKRQLLTAMVLVLAALIALFTADVLHRQQAHLTQQQQALARNLAHTLGASAANWLLARDMAGLKELIEAQRAVGDLEFAMLLDSQGRVMAHTDANRVGQDVLDLPTPAAARLQANEPALVDALLPVHIHGVLVGWSRVGIGQRSAQQQMALLLRDAWLHGALAVLLGSGLALWVVRRMTHQLRAIQRVAERVEAGDDSARVEVSSQDEIGQLARYFNQMLERLKTRGRELADSDRYNKSLFEQSRVAMGVVDPDNLLFLECNRAAQQIYGLPEAGTLVGLTPADVSDVLQYDGTPSDRAAQRQVALALAQGECVFDWRHRRANGELWDAEVHLMVVQTPRGRRLLFTVQDITARRRAEREIHQLAFYDSLTQLPNRRLLQQRLKQAIDRASPDRPGALLLIDIDNFKAVNNTQGHEAGDRLLIEVAHRLRRLFPDHQGLARLGGDEFAVILDASASPSPIGIAGIESVAETLLNILSVPYEMDSGPSTGPHSGPHSGHWTQVSHHCSASLGIVVFQGPGLGADDLLQHADTAMYKAKAQGRNSYRFFDPEMQAAVLARVALEAELRHALEQEQLTLYLQSQVDETQAVVGGEVLLRWIHPARGVVSPMQFIPLAEETGLIIPIGAWVLEQACRHLAAWADEPLTAGWSLAVNVSARQLAQPDFHHQLQDILRRTGADAKRLKLEITESVMMEHAELTLSKLWQLKSMGITLSMDDFGTGYSSLSYLKRLPLDQLKIDRSFVCDIESDPKQAAIARTVVALGHSLGMSVIAEGVETQTQRDRLGELGCRLYQGYLFGRPFPMAELPSWHAAHVARHTRRQPALEER